MTAIKITNTIRPNTGIRISLYAVLFLFPLLGRGLEGGCLFAQNGNGITLSNFTATPGASATTLTIDVQWKPLTNGKQWSDTVWVFADYNNAGTMTRLPLNPAAATLTTHSGIATDCAGCGVDRVRSTADGVWVVGNAREAGSFSATVQMVSICRDARQCVPTGACVYAINYPPKGKYTDAYEVAFRGTPLYDVVLKHPDGSTYTIRTDSPYTLPQTDTLLAFTDATGAPGTLSCLRPTIQTLTASAAGYCANAAGVSLSLTGTQPGVGYELIKDDATVVATLDGSGAAQSFGSSFKAGAYSVRTIETNDFCAVTMPGTLNITATPPGANGQSASPCGCASGLVACSGVCSTNQSRTSTGGCAGCRSQYVYYYDQCGNHYSTGTTSNSSCSSGCCSTAFSRTYTGMLADPLCATEVGFCSALDNSTYKLTRSGQSGSATFTCTVTCTTCK